MSNFSNLILKYHVSKIMWWYIRIVPESMLHHVSHFSALLILDTLVAEVSYEFIPVRPFGRLPVMHFSQKRVQALC